MGRAVQRNVQEEVGYTEAVYAMLHQEASTGIAMRIEILPMISSNFVKHGGGSGAESRSSVFLGVLTSTLWLKE